MNSLKKDSVIIADCQYLVVETLKSMVLEDKRFDLAGIAHSVSELRALLGKTTPGLLITDTANFDYSGLSDLKVIRDENPEVCLLILTNFISKNDFQALARIGIRNIIYKNADRDEILAAMQATLKGKKFYSEEIIDQYLENSGGKYPEEAPKNLTGSEIEIVKLIANGLTTKEIATKRHISDHTVSTHRKNIFKKIGVTNASELIIRAIKAGWIDNIEYYI